MRSRTFKQLSCFILLAALSIAGNMAAQATELKGWLREGPEYPQYQGLEKFFERLSVNSQGRYTGKVLCCDEIGAQKDVIPKFKAGQVDIALFYTSALEPDVPETGVVGLPFIFRNPEHMMASLNGQAGQEIRALLEAKGLIVLAWYDGGARSFYSRNKLLPNASDFKDQNIRVPNKEELLSMVKALGGKPSTLAFDKLPMAFKAGQIDIAENNLIGYYTSEQYKVAPYFTFSYHVVQPVAVLISSQRWNALPEADRAIFRQSATESAVFAAKERSQRDAEIRSKLEKAGVKFSDFRGANTAISLMKETYAPVAVSPKATELMVKIMTTFPTSK
jgi:tripartite ATP-independent transporter DctP family solute receptor